MFRYSTWEFNEQRGQFYLHQFTTGQPDLNYRNPLVIQEMKDVLTFWLDLGVDGYRMDAVRNVYLYYGLNKLMYVFLLQIIHMVEDEQLRDEPVSGLTNDTDDWNYLTHIYTTDQPETRDILATEFYALLQNYSLQYGIARS